MSKDTALDGGPTANVIYFSSLLPGFKSCSRVIV